MIKCEYNKTLVRWTEKSFRAFINTKRTVRIQNWNCCGHENEMNVTILGSLILPQNVVVSKNLTYNNYINIKQLKLFLNSRLISAEGVTSGNSSE